AGRWSWKWLILLPAKQSRIFTQTLSPKSTAYLWTVCLLRYKLKTNISLEKVGDKMEKEWWMQAEDDTAIYVKKWYKETQKPKAIIQIAHGMAEHIQRYRPFSNYLVEQNIFIYGNDHRGHGQTGEQQGLFGFFSVTDGFAKTTADLYEVTKQIKQDHPNTPLFL